MEYTGPSWSVFIDKLGFVPQTEDLAYVISDSIKNL